MASWAWTSNYILHLAAVHHPKEIDAYGSLTAEFNKVFGPFEEADIH